VQGSHAITAVAHSGIKTAKGVPQLLLPVIVQGMEMGDASSPSPCCGRRRRRKAKPLRDVSGRHGGAIVAQAGARPAALLEHLRQTMGDDLCRLGQAPLQMTDKAARGPVSVSQTEEDDPHFRCLSPWPVLVSVFTSASRAHTYENISTIARATTGTARNGPRFFGLRNRRDQSEVPAKRPTSRAKPTTAGT
jgi:hypothetical protein